MGGVRPDVIRLNAPVFETPNWVYFVSEFSGIVFPERYRVEVHCTNKTMVEHPQLRSVFDGMVSSNTDARLYRAIVAESSAWRHIGP